MYMILDYDNSQEKVPKQDFESFWFIVISKYMLKYCLCVSQSCFFFFCLFD